MIIDTHCHYNLEPLYEDWQKHWQLAQEHEVTAALQIGTSLTTSNVAAQLASKEPKFKAAIGIHPNSKFSSSEFEELSQLLPNPNIIAIGETGLDYFRIDSESDPEQVQLEQAQALIAHIKLAATHKLTLIIHLRDTGEQAYSDFLSIFKKYATTDQKFILHCVSGPLSFIKEALELGAYIGMAGNVTYKNSDHLRSIVKTAPKDRLLLETDAPYLPPIPHRGHTCEPWMIQLTKNFVVEELGLSEETILENTLSIFPQFA